MSEHDTSALNETVLHDWHAANGGKMVAFGGWDMPVQYKTGAIREHLATRRHAGLFDVSHMGRFEVAGAGAEAFLARTDQSHRLSFAFDLRQGGGFFPAALRFCPRR